jgi:hypothetical protein
MFLAVHAIPAYIHERPKYGGTQDCHGNGKTDGHDQICRAHHPSLS